MKQVSFALPPMSRGYHLITSKVMEQVAHLLPEAGVLHLFIKHTSASITINENADPSVRHDFETIINHMVPEGLPFVTHTEEGPDDMPAHIKAALFGSSVSIPIADGRLLLGTWQGIYLCEFRNAATSRNFVATILT